MHFPLWVLLRPPDPDLYPTDEEIEDYVRAEVEELMIPFSQDLQYPAYCRPCHCVGRAAREGAAYQARLLADERTNVPELMRTEKDREYWETTFDRAYRRRFDIHPDRYKADPDCEDCGGRGKIRTTSNPKGQCDWWEIGGRWCYNLIDPDLHDDRETAFKVFDLADSRTPVFAGEDRHVSQTALKREELERIPGNVLWTRDVLRHLPVLPDAVLTPCGEWRSLTDCDAVLKYGWHLRFTSKPAGEWEIEVRALLKENLDSLLVVVDCHV